MRFRLPDLMATHKPPLKTAYALAKLSRGEITPSTAQRLVDAGHHPARVDLKTLDAICDTLGCEPHELFERDKPPRKTRAA